MLHLVPAWQSSDKHIRLKKVMEDRPDLIASELSGLAFDSLQQCFRKADVERFLFELLAPNPVIYEDIYIFVDPAAGGPSSDYAIMSVTRNRGSMVVSMGCQQTRYSSLTMRTRSPACKRWSCSHSRTTLSCKTVKKRLAFAWFIGCVPSMLHACMRSSNSTALFLVLDEAEPASCLL
jgi:hypothetical protein